MTNPTLFSVKQCLQNHVPVDTQVIVRGWIRTRRDSKAGISFLNVHDGSCFDPIQVVAPQELSNYQTDILKLTAGCSVIVTGQLVASVGKGQTFEIHANHVEVVGFVEDPESYPMSAKHHSLEHLRDYAHLRPRTNTIGAMTRVRHSLAQAIHQFFDEQGFCWIATPIITASDCEGAGEMFRVSTLDLQNLPKNAQNKIDFSQDFFGQETYLTVSGQLNAESYCTALSKVYTFGPTFRAENSNTSRHLAEFWMVEPEVAFANLQDMVALSDALLKFVFKKVLAQREDDLNFFTHRVDQTCIERLTQFIDAKMAVIDYTDAIKILEKSHQSFDYKVAWGMDLQTEHERYLAEVYVKGPVAIINYPKEIKSFYMRLNEDQKTVAAMDVLVPGIGELVGGSQREERLPFLDARMNELKLPLDHYQWYRDLRRYGSVPHAGFGLGFERLVSYVTGLNNVRDVIAFPRTPKSADF